MMLDHSFTGKENLEKQDIRLQLVIEFKHLLIDQYGGDALAYLADIDKITKYIADGKLQKT
ncbi:hypothetical protein [Acinetobacter larvae]|uniref:Uncharacterized protein n=1 Tax=Acinetobacter larvae TaxID=1789224 RepID=A0A1B2LZI7_9GAMM|nr:hypothetical protein [Acinetobacter larvae]AOA58319.1 hypothetical protein BFG52_08095 [Acinetobacter larvae]